MVNEHHADGDLHVRRLRGDEACHLGARHAHRRGCWCSAIRSGNRPDPLRAAEELATIDVISRGRLDMGFVKGVPYESRGRQTAIRVRMMDRFWEAHDFIIKAMTTPRRAVQLGRRVFPVPPGQRLAAGVAGAASAGVVARPAARPQARVLGERGYVMATLGTGYGTRKLYDAYRKSYVGEASARRRAPIASPISAWSRSHMTGTEARRRGASGRRLSAHQPDRVIRRSAIRRAICSPRGQCRGCCAARRPPRSYHQRRPRHRRCRHRQRART